MGPPFADMDGKKIRLLGSEGALVGDIVVSQNPEHKKFGMRIDVIVGYTPEGNYCGTYHVKSWDLTKVQIDSIKRSQDEAAAFEVKLI